MSKYCSPITFFVNEEKGIVVAKMEDVHKDCFCIFDSVIRQGLKKGHISYLPAFLALMPRYTSEILTKLNIPDTIVAKAKCNLDSGDVFNEDYGIELARTRLLKQLFAIRGKIMTNLAQEILGLGDMFAESATYSYDRVDDMDDDVNYLIALTASDEDGEEDDKEDYDEDSKEGQEA